MAIDGDRAVVVPDGALWIGGSHPFDLHEAYLRFRAPVVVCEELGPGQTTLYLTADSRYKLWVNGRFVARGPARSWPSAQTVDPIDLSPFLQIGVNQIAVQVYQPGYSHFSYVHRGMAGLLAWLDRDGQTLLVSNEQWRVERDPAFSEQVPRVSIYGSGVEERDMNQVEVWEAVGFDDCHWPAARAITRPGDPPWTGLQPRKIPFLRERSLAMKPLDFRLGLYPAEVDDDPHLALREGWSSAVTSAGQAVDGGWFAPRLNDGENALWLFDLGRDYTVQGFIEIEGAGGGEKCAVSYAEKMRDGELVISDPETYCRVRLTDRFTLRPGDQLCQTFALRGGRYLLFQLVGPTSDGFRLRLGALTAEYPLEVTRPLHLNDPLLDQISRMCEDTFRACLQDGFVDCVWRESSQWLGDALPQSRILLSMNDDVRPLRQMITMAAEGAYPDGIFPSVSPAEVHPYTIVSYSMMWLELLAIYEAETGDLTFVDRLWPRLQKMVNGIFQTRHKNGLLLSPPGRRFYVDWAPLSQNQPHAVYNLLYLRGLEFAIELAHKIGRIDEAGRWRARSKALRQIVQIFYRHDGRWFDDLERSTYSQLTAALAILTGTAKPDEQLILGEMLAARSLNPSDEPQTAEMVLASPFMHHYIFEALRHIGRHQDVIDIIKLRWGRWVEQGYPTTWENWSVDFPDGSQCHAFSAHPRYHLYEIAKIRPDLLSNLEKDLLKKTTD